MQCNAHGLRVKVHRFTASPTLGGCRLLPASYVLLLLRLFPLAQPLPLQLWPLGVSYSINFCYFYFRRESSPSATFHQNETFYTAVLKYKSNYMRQLSDKHYIFRLLRDEIIMFRF